MVLMCISTISKMFGHPLQSLLVICMFLFLNGQMAYFFIDLREFFIYSGY